MSAEHHFKFPRVREMTTEDRAAQARLVRSGGSMAPAAPKAKTTFSLPRSGQS